MLGGRGLARRGRRIADRGAELRVRPERPDPIVPVTREPKFSYRRCEELDLGANKRPTYPLPHAKNCPDQEPVGVD